MGADLYIEKKITLIEALTGFKMSFDYFEGKKIEVVTLPGEVIKPGIFLSNEGTIKTIKGKGMPFFKDAMGHGNMYVKFDVEFPGKGDLEKAQIDALKEVLTGPKHDLSHKKDADYLEDFHEADTNPNPEGGRINNEEDEEDIRGGQRVQCGQQ